MKLDKYLIKGFVGSLLAKNFDAATNIPWFHEEFWDLCCSDNKYVAIAAPRGHAKSTSITLSYGLASVLFRDRSFVVIVSDTEAQSILFLNQMKSELLDNEELRTAFGVDALEKDTEKDIIVRMADGHRFRIVARGSQQNVRGLLWHGQRPDLILGDDLENDEIVLNSDRREKFRRWVYGALLPIISARGIVRFVGTILHLDSFLNRVMPNENSKTTVLEELKVYSTKKNEFWTSVKYRAHNSDYSKILWPSRWDKKKLQTIRAQYVEEGLPDVYSQEYLNHPLDESRAYFKKHEFSPIEERTLENIIGGTLELNYYVGVDLAISDKERADYSAFVVAGVDSKNKMYVVEAIRERMDSLEILETIFYLQRKYNPETFCIERGQLEKALKPFLIEEAFKRNIFPSMEVITPSLDKLVRARAIQGRMRIGGVFFDKESEWFPVFESELLSFNRGRNDDQVDAFAYIGLWLEKIAPGRSEEEIVEDNWAEFIEEYQHKDRGRSATTGY